MKRHSARMLSVVWLVAVVAGCGTAEQRLAGRLDRTLNRLSATGAVVHARVVELPSRQDLYASRADEACTPASNFKLLTSATGLDMFGADHRVKTYLAMDGDDLWIIGTGDPGTGDPRLAKAAGGTTVTLLEQWAKVLEQRGIRQIKGDLVYDDSAFEHEPQVHATWPRDWLLQWYAAPTTGLSFNDNCVDITVFPTADGKPVRYEIMPPVENVKVINECVARKKGSPTIVKLADGNTYKLGGGCRERTELKSKPVCDPGAFFADALRVQLKSRGIQVAGRIRRADAPLGGSIPPPSAKIIAVHETMMQDILGRINKNSQNLFAECLCKMTGREFAARQGQRVPGSWENGNAALRAFLQRSGVDDRALVPIDGSGLSPANRVTTRMMTDLLAVMHGRPDSAAYHASLAAAGVDGSLKDRMRGLVGHVFGKTGYIGGVSSLSGYIQTHDGNWLAFSFIYNDIPEKIGDDEDVQPFTKLMDEACSVLVDWPAAETSSIWR